MFDQSLPFGATPIDDSSGLRLQWIKTRDQLNEVEADHILQASSSYFSRRQFPSGWFSEPNLKKIHREMFKSIWDWAGIYYVGPLRNIGIRSLHIPIQVRELCSNVLFWLTDNTDLTFLEQSAYIHFRLAQIHPFSNGNGRHARFVADLYLHSLHGERPHWPENILVAESAPRKEYIESLRSADQGDYSPLIALIVKHGGRNPSPTHVSTSPFFKRHFPSKKLEQTMHNLLAFAKDPLITTPH
ncbi:MAG TPA: mobile mystery protein B [Chlamydiales bacterium]|nr:mobile mystery protein B [Chlamydiales bacterium]